MSSDKIIKFIYPTLFLIFCFSTPYNIHISEDLTETTDSVLTYISEGFTEGRNLARSISLIGLLLIAVFILLSRSRSQLCINGFLSIVIIAFISFSVFSILWTDDISLTFKKISVLIIFSIAASAIASRLSVLQITLLSYFVSSTTLLLGIICSVLLGSFHPLSPDYRFAGVMYPNQEAINCTVLIISAVSLFLTTLRYQRLWLISAIIALIFLILTKSRTPFACVLLTICIGLFVLGYKRLFFKWAWITTFIIIVFYYFIGDSVLLSMKNVVFLWRENPHLPTLTGRIPLWKNLLHFVAERPILGYGYNSFWITDRILLILRKTGFLLANSHNSYIEIMLSIGIPGLALFFISQVAAIKRICFYIFKLKKDEYLFFLLILIWMILHRMMESLTTGTYFFIFLFFVLMAHIGFIKTKGPSLTVYDAGRSRGVR
jgi:O-antigen ligase